VAAFLGVPLENQTRAVILERCSFDYMKANEEKFDFAGEFLRQHGYRAGQFLRRGVEGEGRGSIPAALQAEFQRRVEQQPERAGLEWRIQDFLH
jgi:hypothetical protein